MSKLLINKLPLWKGQTQRGVKMAPAMLEKIITKMYFNKYSTGKIISAGIPDKYINTTDNIQNTIYYDGINLMRQYKKGDFLINLGGDHAISMGTVPLMVFKYPSLKVIWVDAHTDIHSPDTSLTGNSHGMPVHFMTELSEPPLYNKLKLKNLCYYGIRDLDHSESKVIQQHNVKNYTTDEIKYDRNTVIDDIDKWLGDSPVHLSIDVDALDPTSFPSTGVCAGNGLNLDDITLLCDKIKEKNLVSMDLVEFNPEIGSEEDVIKSLCNAGSIIERLI